MWRESSLMFALLLAPPGLRTAGVQPHSAEPEERSLCMVLYGPGQTVPTRGVRCVGLVPGTIRLSSVGIRPHVDGRGAVLVSAALTNPWLDEITSATLYWELYDERDLAHPVASGVTRPHVFESPLVIHDSGTITPSVEINGPDAAASYRLVLGVESATFTNGRMWNRP
jgi:hypothetical protein